MKELVDALIRKLVASDAFKDAVVMLVADAVQQALEDEVLFTESRVEAICRDIVESADYSVSVSA